MEEKHDLGGALTSSEGGGKHPDGDSSQERDADPTKHHAGGTATTHDVSSSESNTAGAPTSPESPSEGQADPSRSDRQAIHAAMRSLSAWSAIPMDFRLSGSQRVMTWKAWDLAVEEGTKWMVEEVDGPEKVSESERLMTMWETRNTAWPQERETSVERAISSDDPKKVSDLLGSMDNALAIRQLTGCYGGRGNGNGYPMKDNNGLYRMTNPLLHAAYSGNIDIFSAVLGAMRDKLRVQQVKRAVASRDRRARSVLAMAALSNNHSMLGAALAALEEHLSTDEVKEVMMASSDGGNVLVWAAAGGCTDIFQATRIALQAPQGPLTQEEVKGLMMFKGGPFSLFENILEAAASSGDKNTWEAVLAEMKRSEVKEADYMKMTSRDTYGSPRNVLHSAVQSGSIRTFQVVLADMKDLTQGELHETLGVGSKNLLHTAAESGRKDMFKAVRDALSHQKYSPLQVDDLMSSSASFGRSILYFAAKSGSTVMFKAVLDIMEEMEERKPHGSCRKAKSMLMASSEEDDGEVVASVLHAAANSGNREMFEAVLAAMRRLTPDEVKLAIQSTRGSDILFYKLDDPWIFNIGDLRDSRWTILHSAAHSGSKAVVEAVLAAMDQLKLSPDEVSTMLTFSGGEKPHGYSILHSAAVSGDVDVFKALLAVPVGAAMGDDIFEAILARPGGKTLKVKETRRLLAAAVSSESVDLLPVVVGKIKQVLLGSATAADDEWKAVAKASVSLFFELPCYAASRGNVGMCMAVAKAWDEMYEGLQAEERLPAWTSRLLLWEYKETPWGAMESMDPATIRSVYRFVRHVLPIEKANKVLGKGVARRFSSWAETVLGTGFSVAAPPVDAGGLGWAIEVLSCLLEDPAVIDPNDLVKLSRGIPHHWLCTCFLETVASVENPFVPGTTLSVGLSKAAVVAPKGERRALTSLQNKVDNLLLEILERLPRTVQGFHGGIAGCAALFEPEVKAGGAREFLGPLWMMLQSREHTATFCGLPLIVDFLAHRFSYGLPSLMRTEGIPSDEYGATHGPCLIIDIQDKVILDHGNQLLCIQGDILGSLLSPCLMLQGVSPSVIAPISTSLSVLPGAQFLTAGLVAMPDEYYRVPAMRIALDVIVHLGMLIVFSAVVLLHDEGPLTAGEIMFACYVGAGIITEIREITWGFSSYIADHWNPIDVLGLCLVAGGLVVRAVDATNAWGRASYALSAPLLFTRVLFFFQMFRFQGPMIQVIFSMIGELFKFGVVIFVIMLGFAMAFYSLFRDVDTLGQTFLNLFKAMLGEVGFFDKFLGEEGEDYSQYRVHEQVATALFVIYLVVIAVMLLNLLIAVLSTSHAKIQEKAEQEFTVSRAHLISRYRLVVDKHLLPPPFNLVQLVLSVPFILVDRLVDRAWHGPRCTRAREAVGRVVFWLVMGTLAVIGGTLLWLLSASYAPFKWRRFYTEYKAALNTEQEQLLSPVSIALRYVVIFFWCILGAPMYFAVFWLTAPLKWVELRPLSRVWSRRGVLDGIKKDPPKSLHEILRGCPGGLSVIELQEFLEDPMSDPQVRQDEKSRATTVEHIKQLRDRVESAFLKGMEQEMARHSNQVDFRLARIEEDVASIQEMMGRKMDKILEVVQGGRRQVTASKYSRYNTV